MQNLEHAGNGLSAALLDRVFSLAADKVRSLAASWNHADGAPVYTIKGRYKARNWTQWTHGFQLGMPLLVFDATSDQAILAAACKSIMAVMPTHVSHTGVHDHGFNNISTYGNWRRLMREGRIPHDAAALNMLELALKASGAVQAHRWTAIPANPAEKPALFDGGYIYSFNGPHSLFSDTIRSLRSLVVAWQLGHSLAGENDVGINLLGRAMRHAMATARYNVYYGQGRDIYDFEPGRVVHESIFNTNDGRYRCPSSQQGYSPFSTWTRGLAWILLGFAEQLEFLHTLAAKDWTTLAADIDPASKPDAVRTNVEAIYLNAARSTADWYIEHSFDDGMVYWDAGAPDLPRPVRYHGAMSDPHNDHEPIDSSAAAIAGQGFFRLGRVLAGTDAAAAKRYHHAALCIAHTLFQEPYLSLQSDHQGLILHSVYHRPNGWDYIPPGRKVPCGESSMWGDYHALELALVLKRHLEGKPTPTFFEQP